MSAILAEPYTYLRQMQETDLSMIIDIEQATYRFPWSPKTFIDCLQIGYRAWVLEQNCTSHLSRMAETILGYGLMSVGAGEAHILNICVRPERQRCGYGRQILLHLLALAREEGVTTLFLEVRPSNHAAIRLYTQMKFNHIGVRKNYYPGEEGQRENALVFALTL